MNPNGQSTPAHFHEMTLEDLPNKSGTTAAPPSAGDRDASSRSTGENLFAAKKAPEREKFHYDLGIIPTAIIIALFLTIAGGIYVWIEIQPPTIAQRRSPPPAVVASTAPTPRAPATEPLPPIALPHENKPRAEARQKVSRPAPTPAPAAENRARPGNVKQAPATQAEPDIQIQHKLVNDAIYNTLMVAYQAYHKGDLGGAWQSYREVLLKDAKNRDALLGMAAIAQQIGEDDSAVQYYQHVLALDPRDPVALAGMSAFSTGDAASKESRLKQSIALTPQSAELHFALGNLYTEQSRWGDAQQAYFNAFRLEPSNAQFAFGLATSLDHLGQAKLAAQYYAQALKLDTTGTAGFGRIQTEQRMKQLLAP